ncbi:AraC family transcriptional regulator [Paenibacillus sp. MMS20-IR301]|uniref:helix-turn-helix transcriptional regulator n=1 Tax=Paenibacillus sp. MMS20-IR301 TaxID=2895946 RepID=UPI0028F132F9|nr:AraC family transcriptional regulator [Paenibacillus sp. MMS20-IR301]WNS46503.1 AraC family transcriptional regulator [Paenibacillus sp. MMS20-IR301]
MTSVTSPSPKYYIAEGRFSIQHMKRKGINAMPRPHSHELTELYYLTEGERIYFVDDRVVTVRKGELILIPGGELHATASSEMAEFERILINYDPQLLPSVLQADSLWFQNHRYRLFRLTLREQNEAETLLKRILEESRMQQPLYETAVVTLFTELMVLLQRSESTTQAGGMKHPLHHLVTDVAAYIRVHHREALTLEEVAGHFFISPSYLSRVFHRLTGFHFREYIVHIRVREAQLLLSSSAAKIQEIASRVGFEHLSHFNKIFKRTTGLTPLQYRKKSRARPPLHNEG